MAVGADWGRGARGQREVYWPGKETRNAERRWGGGFCHNSCEIELKLKMKPQVKRKSFERRPLSARR